MKHFLTPSQMYDLDKFTIEEIGMPVALLMENAASFSAREILKRVDKNSSVLVLCGSGNNGGDGFALARHLSPYLDVEIVWIGSVEKMSQETLTNYKLVHNLNLPCCRFETEEDVALLKLQHDVIVDAFIGIGAGENLKGLVPSMLERVNKYSAFKVAIDSPSGLNCLTGKAHESSFSADLTITMYAEKLGLRLESGPEICGEIVVANLGLKDDQVFYHSKISAIELEDIKKLLGKRSRLSSKYDHGRITIIAGSMSMPGASVLAANAASVIGAGLVHLTVIDHPKGLIPEVMKINCEANENGFLSSNNFERINQVASDSDVLLFGPGLGIEVETIELVKRLIEENQSKKILIDADALSVLDSKSSLENNFVITPHVGELARIFDVDRKEIENKRYENSIELAGKLNCVMLLKGSPTIISDGTWSYLNLTGNPALAKGGSGDVLSGIIAGLMAQGLVPFEAAAAGAHIHGLVADNYISKYNERTFLASEIINGLKEIEY